MNINILYIKENEELQPNYYQCGNCKRIYNNKEYAEKCCKPFTCSKCGREISRDFNKILENYYESNGKILCYDCWSKQKWDNLPVITEEGYNKLSKEDTTYGPACLDDRFNEDLYGLLEDIADDYDKAPEYIQVAKYEKVHPIKIDDCLESIVEDMCLDEPPYMEDIFVDLNELYDFIQKWNKKQKYTYLVSEDRKIKLSEETKKEYFGDKP